MLAAILYQVRRTMLKKMRSTQAPTVRRIPTQGARRSGNRRTTLTLPNSVLRQLERLAHERHQNLSSLVAGLLREALMTSDLATERPARVLEMWKKAFAPLTEEKCFWSMASSWKTPKQHRND